MQRLRVFLFLAGLIVGYYDNLAVFNHIGERIAATVSYSKFFQNAAARLGEFVEGNLGAIMGNFLFGVFLGRLHTWLHFRFTARHSPYCLFVC